MAIKPIAVLPAGSTLFSRNRFVQQWPRDIPTQATIIAVSQVANVKFRCDNESDLLDICNVILRAGVREMLWYYYIAPRAITA